jgi:predicted ATPase
MMAPSPGTRSFVGRTSEVASLDELLRRAAEGPCQVGLIEGEAGIGKSRLVTEVLHRARGLGFQPYIGAAAELERDRPFGALVEALDLHPTSSDPERAEIGHLLVGDPEPVRGGALTLADAPTLRFRVLEAVLTLVLLGAREMRRCDKFHAAAPRRALVTESATAWSTTRRAWRSAGGAGGWSAASRGTSSRSWTLV